MTTIQDRIIKEGLNKFGLCFQIEDEQGNVSEQATNWWKEQFQQFIIQSIKEVEQETRKEIFDNLPKVIEPPKDIEKFNEKRQAFLAGQMNMLMRLNDLNLSITNKEKQK